MAVEQAQQQVAVEARQRQRRRMRRRWRQSSRRGLLRWRRRQPRRGCVRRQQKQKQEQEVEALRQCRQKRRQRQQVEVLRQFHRHLLNYLLSQERDPREEMLLQNKWPLTYVALLLPMTAPLQPQPRPQLQLMDLPHPPEKTPEEPRKNKDSSELAEIIGNEKAGVPPIASKNTRFKNQSRNK